MRGFLEAARMMTRLWNGVLTVSKCGVWWNLGRDSTDPDMLGLIFAQRTESNVYHSHSSLSPLVVGSPS